MKKPGILYVIATPIGNLEDITLRAIKILQEVDLCLSEDTRKTKILLARYKIEVPLLSLHQYTKPEKIERIIAQLEEGKKMALLSEAGTPGISDPGNQFIEAVVKRGLIRIVPIPGPCAAIAALSVSGFPSERFCFLGFLPKKKGRQKIISALPQGTIVFYESPYRIIKTLKEIEQKIGDQEIVVCREMTKRFEEIYRGKISAVISQIKPKGEFTIVMQRKDEKH